MQLRINQLKASSEVAAIILKYKLAYLAGEVRSGKTLSALNVAHLLQYSNVLFITKKKAISSIQKDFEAMQYKYNLYVINYESMHLLDNIYFDFVILDEAHTCFLGNTLINGVKIKDIKVGSFQKCFNFAKNQYEYKKVLNVFKNKLIEDLVKIKCNGKEIICTKSHKIYTKRGWIKAGELLPTDKLQVVQ
jgi:hypothetical protein